MSIRKLVDDTCDVASRLGLEISGIHHEGDDVVLLPSRVLGLDEMFNLFRVREDLKARGHHAVGAYMWNRDDGRHVFRVFVAVSLGRIVTIHIPNDPSLSIEEITWRWFSEDLRKPPQREKDEKGIFVPALTIRYSYDDVSEHEKIMFFAAAYFVDPAPEEVVMKLMTKYVGREIAEEIASLVWRIAYGEGYTLAEWARLIERNTLCSSWEPIQIFQELVKMGLRRKHHADLVSRSIDDLEDWEILRAASKYLATC